MLDYLIDEVSKAFYLIFTNFILDKKEVDLVNKVIVLGSLNVDTILKIKRFPNPGETLETLDKSSAAGGKGANQAVAAVRSGAQTTMIGQIGHDDLGKFMIDSLQNDHINVSPITVNGTVGTGTATVLLDENGQNCILVYGGANQKISPEDIKKISDNIKNSDFLISQFETPQNATKAAFEIAKENSLTTILNPAPASKIDSSLLTLTDLIVPNETESAVLTGIKITDEKSMIETAKAFSKMGIDNLIITIGDRGVFYSTKEKSELISAYHVKAVDTTAAGDTFIGALSSQLKKDLSNIKSAISFAQCASSITVQRLGAQPSIPTLNEIRIAEMNYESVKN
ncbi:ribokinase [Oenococcus oeni]|uniref:Ribokinase n=1 Tax=Oenococcus oeni TaxID=1247 RepID=A0AAQ2ZEK6_OENOE|nr:ribokinase [Oenococcus oeni]SYW09580.1 ribokinase [Oenococcus oeni]VDB98980.1 ribokinase [Oenococcus oeni]